MPTFRWLPESAKSPKQHLTIGGLVYGGEYDHPDCAHDPDFKLVDDKPGSEANPIVVATEHDNQTEGEHDDDPDADEAQAGHPGGR